MQLGAARLWARTMFHRQREVETRWPAVKYGWLIGCGEGEREMVMGGGGSMREKGLLAQGEAILI
jgi:hypothetical protein